MFTSHFARVTQHALTGLCAILLLALEPHGFVQARAWLGGLVLDDPELTYSTTFGRGTGEVREIAVDTDGNIVIAGVTGSQFLFPLINAADDTYGDSGQEGFITKISASGDELIYSTYLGGDDDDWVSALALDAAGNAYVCGTTVSLDFPTTGALQPLPNIGQGGFVRDGFVAKLAPNGDLLWSTHLGGESSDEAHDIAVDAGGAVVVVGQTSSVDFPSANGFQSACNLNPTTERCADAFITKISGDGSSIQFSTFLGGSAAGIGEQACGVSLDGSGNVYVIGENRSDDFPLLSPFQSERGGGISDLFVTKLAATGNALIWSSHLGGADDEFSCSVLSRGSTIAVDSQSDAFIAFTTKSADLPVMGGLPASTQEDDTDVFAAKITSGGTLAWSTYLGGSGSDFAHNVALSSAGTPVLTGWTTSTGFPLTSDALPEADCPLAQTPNCTTDAFVTALDADDGSLAFSTYLGGDDSDQGSGVCVTPDDTIYVAGWTKTDLWPEVNALPSVYGGSGTVQMFVSAIGSADPAIPGDANGDGTISATDALLALSVAVGAGECALCICDVSGDGAITATDALIVLNLAVGLPVATNAPPC